LGVTRQTAKVIIHRARYRLRDALALELMVRRLQPGCAIFDALEDDVIAASRHVRTCPACEELVAAEIELYASEPEALHPDEAAHPSWPAGRRAEGDWGAGGLQPRWRWHWRWWAQAAAGAGALRRHPHPRRPSRRRPSRPPTGTPLVERWPRGGRSPSSSPST